MVARAIPGLGMGLNPYIDPNAAVTAPDPSQALMPTGSALGNGIGSWLGALGMALLSSPRQSPFQTLPQIMPGMMQQQMQQAALAQQAGIWNAGIKAFGQGPGLDSLFPAGGAPGAPPAPQYPDAGMPGMSTGGAIPNAIRGNSPVDTFLNLTGQHESGWRNIMQQAVGPNGGFNPSTGTVTGPSSAQGYFQITDSTWKNFAPKAGVDLDQYPNAMQAPYDVQRAVAKTIATTSGVQHWTSYNPRLRAAVMSIGLPTSGPISDAPAPSAVPAVQYAQASPQTMTDASSGARPGVQMLPNPFTPDSQSGTTPTAAGPSAQYAPDEIAKYRAAGLPLSPQSAQQVIQNQNGQAPSATAPQSLPDGTPQRPSTLAQAQTGPGPGPTPLQQQQALAAVQRPPPPSPDTVSGGLASQRAAAMRYYEYYGNLALRLAPFGEAGKTFADLAMKRMDIAKELLTEDQKKRLDLQYAVPLAAATETGKISGQLGAAGLTDPNSPEYQTRALNMIPDTRPEAQRNAAFAYPGNPATQQQVVGGSIAGNQPTDLQKAVRAMMQFPPGSPERRMAEAAVAKASGIDVVLGGTRPGVPGRMYDYQSGQYLPAFQTPTLPPGGVLNPDSSIGLAPGAQQAYGAMEAVQSGARKQGENLSEYTPLGALPNGAAPTSAGAGGQKAELPGTPLAAGYTTVVPPVREPDLSPAEFKASIPEWRKDTNELSATVIPSQQAEHRLQNIADAFKMVQTGAYLSQKAAFDTLLKGIGIPSTVSGDPAAVQLALHENARATLQTLGAANKRFTQNEFQTIAQQSEHPNLQPEANLAMLAEDIASLRQLRGLATDWRTAQLAGAHNFDAFRTDWLNSNPLSSISDVVKKEIGPLKGMSGAANAAAAAPAAPPLPPAVYQPAAPGQTVPIPPAGQQQSAQPAQPAAPSYQEGTLATNPKTGEVRIMRGGQWMPFR